MLVAEIFYPNNNEDFPATTPPPLQDFQKYQEYLQKRAGLAQNDTASAFFEQQAQKNNKKKQNQICDGYDEIGCFQIRLYYDWFLIPGKNLAHNNSLDCSHYLVFIIFLCFTGSCKCWRPDYFAKYVKKRPITPEL